jgi:hypothetical protein
VEQIKYNRWLPTNSWLPLYFPRVLEPWYKNRIDQVVGTANSEKWSVD